MLIKSCDIFYFLGRMQLNQVILQCHCNHDLKNMHSMLFLKTQCPACSRNDPYPHHERDLPHATPPPSSSILSLWLFQESSSPHTYPPPKLIKKKTVHTPTPEGMCPMLPVPDVFEFSRIAPVPKYTPSCCLDSY